MGGKEIVSTSIIVVMCLVTTAAAAPLLHFLYRAERGATKM